MVASCVRASALGRGPQLDDHAQMLACDLAEKHRQQSASFRTCLPIFHKTAVILSNCIGAASCSFSPLLRSLL